MIDDEALRQEALKEEILAVLREQIEKLDRLIESPTLEEEAAREELKRANRSEKRWIGVACASIGILIGAICTAAAAMHNPQMVVVKSSFEDWSATSNASYSRGPLGMMDV